MTITRREFEELRRDLARTRQELAQRPLFGGGGGAAANLRLLIVGGNILSDAVTEGIVWEEAGVTEVPTLYDPDIDTSFVDGIGRAVLYVDNVAQSGYVLVAHFYGDGSSDMRAWYADQTVGTTANTITLPLTGDPTQFVTLYVAFR